MSLRVELAPAKCELCKVLSEIEEEHALEHLDRIFKLFHLSSAHGLTP